MQLHVLFVFPSYLELVIKADFIFILLHTCQKSEQTAPRGTNMSIKTIFNPINTDKNIGVFLLKINKFTDDSDSRNLSSQVLVLEESVGWSESVLWSFFGVLIVTWESVLSISNGYHLLNFTIRYDENTSVWKIRQNKSCVV